MARRRSALTTIGWREWTLLPEITVVPIKAKVDTGALTSTLHAHDMRVEQRDTEWWVDFEVHPVQRSRRERSRATLPIHTFKNVRSSTGHTESRPVIRTTLRVGDRELLIDLTLTARDAMGFRLLLGRSAMRGRFVVDPGRSFLCTPTIGEDPTT